jgi:hypothetical protein
MDDFPLIPPIIVKDTPKPRRITMVKEKLDMDPHVSGVPAGRHLNLAVGPVVLAVRCLQNEATTVREPSLEGEKRLVFYFVASVTMRQLIKVVHGA